MPRRRHRVEEGQPSSAARARLATDLADELGRTRLAWEAASLRSDRALDDGDRAEAMAALDEQRALLRSLHTSLDAVVARAVVTREAEDAATATVDGAGGSGPSHPRPQPVRRSLAVLTVAAVAALFAVGGSLANLPSTRLVVAGDVGPASAAPADLDPPVLDAEAEASRIRRLWELDRLPAPSAADGSVDEASEDAPEPAADDDSEPSPRPTSAGVVAAEDAERSPRSAPEPAEDDRASEEEPGSGLQRLRETLQLPEARSEAHLGEDGELGFDQLLGPVGGALSTPSRPRSTGRSVESGVEATAP